MDLPPGLPVPTVPHVMHLLVLLPGAYVSVDMGQRVRRRSAAERWPWLVAAVVALSTGLWAAAVLNAAELATGPASGFDIVLAGAALLATLWLGLPGMRWSLASGTSSTRLLLGAAFLGTAALATQVLTLGAAAQTLNAGWNPGLLFLAWLAACSGFGWGLRATRTSSEASASPQRHGVAAVVSGLGVLSARWLALAAVGLPIPGVTASQTVIASGSMTMLASVGGTELLLVMLLACVIETRMRHRLENARSELQAHAHRDDLTRLPNRVSVEAALAQAQQLANRQHTQVTLLVIALDGIKHVNESFGHQFGDRVLQRVAQRLRALAKPHSVARLGGDEFLMLLHDDAATQQGLPLAAQVIDSVSQPINLDGRNLSVGCSIGLAFYPQHGSMSALIANAGVAMRGATYSIFDARMVVDARGQAALLRDLRLAPGHSQLELYYQPKIHAPSAQITGVEALLRWHHPQRGTTSRTSSFRWPDAAA